MQNKPNIITRLSSVASMVVNTDRSKSSSFTGSHESDLEIRLQNVADKAKPKGQRKPMCSTASIAMTRKRDNKNRRSQFGGSLDVTTGRHKMFKKDGQMTERVL